MTFHKKNQAGFSLIEMLVAVSILLLVIVGPMTITARTAKSSTFATEQVEAFFLAQEGLEIVQKVRDDLLLEYFAGTADPWTRFTNTSNAGILWHCYNPNGCGLEWARSVPLAGLIAPVRSCVIVSNCLLHFDATPALRSQYTYIAPFIPNPTKYTRIIRLIQNGDNVFVRSTVTWRTGSLVADQRVEVNTYLYRLYAPS